MILTIYRKTELPSSSTIFDKSTFCNSCSQQKNKKVSFTISPKMVPVSSCWIFLFEWKWVFSYFEIPDLFGKLNFESRKNPVDPTREREGEFFLLEVIWDLQTMQG